MTLGIVTAIASVVIVVAAVAIVVVGYVFVAAGEWMAKLKPEIEL